MRISLLIIFSILCAFGGGARTTQKGLVKEYNEKARKTPLAGVELRVRHAGSTVSDNRGEFLLDFPTLNPGDNISVREIGKDGYEVFNKDAIEQWNVNPEKPFTIVMCRSDKFKKIKDNYERVSSASYDRQMRREQEELARLKSEGRIRQEEYERKLAKLSQNYEAQLDRLDAYVERFARIDLSELSDGEQEIIDLVSEGRLDEAIAKYEERNYVAQYLRERSDLSTITNAIDKLDALRKDKELSSDSLLAAVDRQIDTYILAGGKDNFASAEKIILEIADADTTNLERQLKAGEFLGGQNKYQEALPYFLWATESDNSTTRFKAMFDVGTCYSSLNDYDQALYWTQRCLDLPEELNRPEISLFVLSQIADCQRKANNHPGIYYDKIEGLIDRINDDTFFSNFSISIALMICAIPQNNEISEFDEEKILRSMIYAEIAEEMASTEYERETIEDHLNCLKTTYNMMSFEKGKELPYAAEELAEIYRKKFDFNPNAYSLKYVLSEITFLQDLLSKDVSDIKSKWVGFLNRIQPYISIYRTALLDRLDNMMSLCKKRENMQLSISLFDTFINNIALDNLGTDEKERLAYLYLKRASIYEEDASIPFVEKSIALYSELKSTNELDSISASLYFPLALNTYAELLRKKGDFQNALASSEKAVSLLLEVQQIELNYSLLISNLWIAGICNHSLGNIAEYIGYMNRMVSYEQYNTAGILDEPLSWAYNNLSFHEYENGSIEKAMLLIDRALFLNPDAIPPLDNKGLYLLKLGKRTEAMTIAEKLMNLLPEEVWRTCDLYKALNEQ